MSTNSYVTQYTLSSNGYLTSHQDLSNYATKSYVDEKISEIPEVDLSGYVTKNELSNAGYITSIPSEYITQAELNSMSYVTQSGLSSNGYLTSHQDLSNYATKAYVDEKINAIPEVDLSSYATKAYVAEYVATNAPQPDLGSYVTKTELSNAGYITSIPSEYITQTELSLNGYLTSHQDLSSYATKAYVDEKINAIPEVDLSSYVTNNELNAAGYITSIPSEYITQDELSAKGYVTQYQLSANGYLTSHQDLSNYATKAYVDEKISEIPEVDLSSYVTKNELSNAGYITSIPSEYVTQTELSSNGYLTSHQDLSNYATKAYVIEQINAIPEVDLSSYVTKNELNAAGYITSIPNEYITQDELSSNGYLTSHQDLSAYATKVELTENLIPNTDATYMLGDASHMYRYAYIQTLRGKTEGFSLMLGGAPKYDFYGSTFRPRDNNAQTCGSSNYKWSYTYSYNFIENGTNIKDIYATKTYVANYVAQNAPTPDLSAYVSKTELNAAGYITSAVFMYDSTTNSLTIRI